MNIPSFIVAGDSSSWLDTPGVDSLGEPVNSTDYVLSYAIRGPKSLTVTAITDGQGWKTSITTTQSAILTPGEYSWQAYATKSGARVTLGSGKITIKQNLSVAASDYDGRSQTEQDLDAVRAAMRAILKGNAVAEYTIGNRSIKKYAFTELRALETQLIARLSREQKQEKIDNGQGNSSNLLVRFK